MVSRFTNEDFRDVCDLLAAKDKDLARIIGERGYPPMWTRPGTFQTLILTILEQQVSLASAYAAFKRLRARTGTVTPAKLLALSDEELRACSFSRQKIIYARELANAILEKKIILRHLTAMPDEDIRSLLKSVKGIGDWTVDVYLMHALQRSDLFPLGDVALVNSLREVKHLPKDVSKEAMLSIAEAWRPHRTVAAMILWHEYIQKRGIKLMG